MRHLDDGSLQAWLDRSRSGLSAAELDDIERHLSGCDACAERMAEMLVLTRRTRSLLSPTDAGPEPAPDYEEVVARAGRRRESARLRRAWRGTAWAASVAVALGVGWLSNGLYRDRTVARAGNGQEARESTEAPPEVELPRAAEVPGATLGATERGRSSAPEATDTEETDTEETAPRYVAESTPASPAPVTVTADTPAPSVPANVTEVPGARRGAAAPTVVLGRVTDEAGAPLSAAQVIVEGTRIGTLTSRDGRFALYLGEMVGDSAAHDLTLTAQLIGYRGASRMLTVRGGEADTADFRLAQHAVALDEVVVTGVAAGAARDPARGASPEIVVAAGDSTWGKPWSTVNRAEAESQLGFALLLVPDLPVRGMEIGEVEGTPVVRILQDLDGGEGLTLVESTAAVRYAEDVTGADRSTASTRKGHVYVTAAAPMTVGSLVALLDRLR